MRSTATLFHINSCFLLIFFTFMQMLHAKKIEPHYQTIHASWLCPNNYPDEVSLLIADLKFDGTSVKICEFGEALESQFEGYKKLKTKHDPWIDFFSYLDSFNVPIWFVDKYGKHKLNHNELKNKYTVVSNIRALQQNELFKLYELEDQSAGIVIIRNDFKKNMYHNFRKQQSNLMILCRATAPYAQNKKLTCELFQEAECMDFKPKFILCKKNYTPELTKKIIQELNTQNYVIKPIKGAQGNGIIIVSQDDLDATLQIILNHENMWQKKRNNAVYNYWLKDHQDQFIVEAYAPSKKINVEGAMYDPTMRIMFALHNKHGRIFLTFFDAYWKLPEHGIMENVSLTKKYKSHVNKDQISSTMVDHHDFEKVKALLSKALTTLYLKMLEKCFV